MLYIYLALFAALCFSLSDITTKFLLNNGVSNLQYLFWCQGLIYILLTLATLILAVKYSFKFLTNGDNAITVLGFPTGKVGVFMVITTIFSFCGLMALVYAFKISNNIGYTSAIVGTTSLMTFFFSWLIFNKTPELIGLIGALMIVTGVFLISRCNN